MLDSLPFRRYVEQLGSVLKRRRTTRLRLNRRDVSGPVLACVDVLESRELLAAIVVNSLSGAQNYDATVTAGQLDATQTAVTLRDAINAANNTQGADTISFDQSVFPPDALSAATIVLTGGTPLLLKDTSGATSIVAPAAAQVTVSGNNLSTVFQINLGVTATIDGLTITGGKASIDFGVGFKAGGAIYNNGRLTLQNSTLTANTAASYGGGFYNGGTVTVTNSTITGNSAQLGGGFFNGGTVNVTSSTIAGNSATATGGGFYSLGTVALAGSTLANNSAATSGGGFFNSNIVTVTNSTITGNSAGLSGGGFINAKTATVTSSTISGNFASQGAGIFNSATVTLTGSILAANWVSATNHASRDWAGPAAAAASSFNLIGDATNTGLTNGTNHNIAGTSAAPIDPRLGPLGNYGGPTQTLALLSGSLAINAGNNALVTGLATDQRGAGFDRVAGGTVDIGAFEIQSHPPAGATVASLTTTERTPILGGTWDPANAVGLQVTIASSDGSYSATYTLGTSAQLSVDGTAWKLDLVGTSPLGVGTYQVQVHSFNNIGESADSALGTLVIISTPPVVGAVGPSLAKVGEPVNFAAAITGGDTTGLVGTIDWGDGTSVLASFTTVNGVLTASGSHAYATAGTFHIQVTVTNVFGLSAGIGTTATIAIPSHPPATPTVSSVTTTDRTPVLNGTWDSANAIGLQVTIASAATAYSATYTLGTSSQLSFDGATWNLDLGGTSPLAVGTYGVLVHTFNDIGESTDSAPGALVINSTPPVVGAISSFSVNVGEPVNLSAAITGGDVTGLVATIDWGDGTSTVAVIATVNGVLTASGSHEYATAGTFSIQLTATNAFGLSGSVGASAAVTIASHPPATPTVNSVTTTSTTPVLDGTWDPANAIGLQVTIASSDASYSATYTLGTSPQLSVDGAAWKLDLAGTSPLTIGTYSVLVHTVNDIGETADSLLGTLVINSTPPVVNTLGPRSAKVGETLNVSSGIIGGDTTGLVATIDWGDGTSTVAALATMDGVLTATGSHAYATAGSFSIQLTVTNSYGLSSSVGTTASVSSAADLLVSGRQNVQIVAASATANYDFVVKFVAGGVQLVGAHGTTFNGASTLFVANATSISAQLADGNDRVRVTGTGKNVTLDLGGGENRLVCRDFVGAKLDVSSDGALKMRVRDSSLNNLLVTGGAEADRFRAIGLVVRTETNLALGGGANVVRIDDSSFRNFKVQSKGSGTAIRIELGVGNGIDTQFDGTTVFVLGDHSRLRFSPLAKSDQTIFAGNLNISAKSPIVAWYRENVLFARRAVLNDREIG